MAYIFSSLLVPKHRAIPSAGQCCESAPIAAAQPLARLSISRELLLAFLALSGAILKDPAGRHAAADPIDLERGADPELN